MTATLDEIRDLMTQQLAVLKEIRDAVISKRRTDSSLTLEQQAILLIPKYRGNKSRIADALGVHRSTVHRWQDFSDACERSSHVRRKSKNAAISIPKGAVSDGVLDAHSTESQIDAWIEAEEEKRRRVRRSVRKEA